MIGLLQRDGKCVLVSEPVPVSDFSASWIRVDQARDPSFTPRCSTTRAEGCGVAGRAPGAVLPGPQHPLHRYRQNGL